MENGSKKIGLRIAAGFLVAITIIVAVFASGITLPRQEIKTGRLTVLLIDAPVELDRLVINITSLEVHQVEPEGMWIPLLEENDYPITFDLLVYQYGASLNLLSVDIEIGTYNKIRMYVSNATAYYTAEEDDPGVQLKVPPGKIDVITEFELEDGGSKIVTIDMEPDWVHIKNNNLRPVLKASISEDPTNSGDD